MASASSRMTWLGTLWRRLRLWWAIWQRSGWRGPQLPESLAGEALSPAMRRLLRALMAVQHSMARPAISRGGLPARVGPLLFPVGTLLLGMAISSFFWASRPISAVTAASANGRAEVALAAEPTIVPWPSSVEPTISVSVRWEPTAEPSATAIPTPMTTSIAAAPTPALASSPLSPTPAALSEPATDKAKAVTTHTVARGENLFRIALRYGTTVDAIAARNGITDPNRLQAGQILAIP